MEVNNIDQSKENQNILSQIKKLNDLISNSKSFDQIDIEKEMSESQNEVFRLAKAYNQLKKELEEHDSLIKKQNDDFDEISGHVKKLIKITEIIANGNFFFYHPKKETNPKMAVVGNLANNFNKMISKVKEAQDGLKKSLKLQVELTDSYSRFLPHHFLDILNKKSVIDISLSDHIEKEMTVLFSDIRGFTSLSEKMTPKENFRFINSFLSRISPLIHDNKGFIDKYIGDAVMALFPDSPDDALLAAVAMQKAVQLYNSHRQSSGYQAIKIGIGIHFGKLMLGTIGDVKRMDGTVISDAVNLAARMEGLTKLYGASIAVTNNTLLQLNDPSKYTKRDLGKIQVKGKKEAVSVYEIIDGDSEGIFRLKTKTLEEYHKGMSRYYNKDFAKACLNFNNVLDYNPKDKAATYFLHRSAYYMVHGAPKDWKGVETLTSK